MNNVKLRIVNDDWEELFIDGKYINSNHSLGTVNILNYLKRAGIINLEIEYVEED